MAQSQTRRPADLASTMAQHHDHHDKFYLKFYIDGKWVLPKVAGAKVGRASSPSPLPLPCSALFHLFPSSFTVQVAAFPLTSHDIQLAESETEPEDFGRTGPKLAWANGCSSGLTFFGNRSGPGDRMHPSLNRASGRKLFIRRFQNIS